MFFAVTASLDSCKISQVSILISKRRARGALGLHAEHFYYVDVACIALSRYHNMDNVWSGSERDLLNQRPERANALATSTGRRLVMKCAWSRSRGTRLAFSACLQIRYDCTVILTVSVLSSVLEV